MKILYVTTIGSTMGFFRFLIRKLLDEGYIVDIATNEEMSKVQDYYRDWGCKVYPISTSRSPLSFGNIKSIKQIQRIAAKYDIVHCHTPLAGMATRLACRKLRKKQGLRVIYTAHGFHFYKGAPLLNWMIYYPIERVCSIWTDVLITINKEDYELSKRKMKARRVEYVPGVGIDTSYFYATSVDRKKKKAEIGIPTDSIIVLSVGELNENKNHRSVIDALSILDDPRYCYVIAGAGNMRTSLLQFAKEKKVNLYLLGRRTDVNELYHIADLYVLPSFREGLNVSMLEALTSQCPTIVSKIRGNVDIVENCFCFDPDNPRQIAGLVQNYKTVKNSFVKESFDYKNINSILLGIYRSILK